MEKNTLLLRVICIICATVLVCGLLAGCQLFTPGDPTEPSTEPSNDPSDDPSDDPTSAPTEKPSTGDSNLWDEDDALDIPFN